MSDGFQQEASFRQQCCRGRAAFPLDRIARTHARQRALEDKYSAESMMILGSGAINHKMPPQDVLEIDLNACPNLDFLQ